MYEETITIDIDRLRHDMRDEALAGFFGGGLGGMLIEAIDVDRANPEKLVEMAESQGIDIQMYQI